LILFELCLGGLFYLSIRTIFLYWFVSGLADLTTADYSLLGWTLGDGPLVHESSSFWYKLLVFSFYTSNRGLSSLGIFLFKESKSIYYFTSFIDLQLANLNWDADTCASYATEIFSINPYFFKSFFTVNYASSLGSSLIVVTLDLPDNWP
jgi:hypothetical protein